MKFALGFYYFHLCLRDLSILLETVDFVVRPAHWLLRKVRERRKHNRNFELSVAIEFSLEG